MVANVVERHWGDEAMLGQQVSGRVAIEGVVGGEADEVGVAGDPGIWRATVPAAAGGWVGGWVGAAGPEMADQWRLKGLRFHC